MHDVKIHTEHYALVRPNDEITTSYPNILWFMSFGDVDETNDNEIASK